MLESKHVQEGIDTCMQQHMHRELRRKNASKLIIRHRTRKETCIGGIPEAWKLAPIALQDKLHPDGPWRNGIATATLVASVTAV